MEVTGADQLFLLERMADFEIAATAKHNWLMRESQWTIGGLLGLGRFKNAEKQ
eukprot:gene48971-65658_t